jgi:oligopeptide transport system substrate-binding protein
MTTIPRVHWWISLALLLLGGLMAMVFFGSRQSLPVISRPAEDANVLRVVYTQYLLLDPHRRLSPLPSYNHLILSLWEPLVECDPATGQPQPAAAQSWSWSDDRRVLTLKLRPDARWSNGDPVTAHDFVRSWRRLLGKSMDLAQTLFPLKNAEAFHRGQLKDPAALGLRAVDDLTLRLEVGQVRSSLVAELADPLLVPLHQGSEAALADNAYFQDPSLMVTNGPFRLLSASDNGFRLKACDFYHGRAEVRLAGVQFLRVYSLSLAPLLVSAGVADLLSPMPFGKPRPEPTKRPVHLERELELGVTSVDFNVTRGPLRDIRVRQALARALDRGGAISRLDPGQMVPAWSWIPTMPGRPGLTLLQEDAEQARRLLAEAGYPGGQGFPVLEMSLPLWMRSDPFPAMWTENWFQELGVKTHILYEPQAVRAKRMTAAGDYDVIYGGLVATVPDAGDMLSGFLWPAEYSTTKWVDQDVIYLLNEANTRTGAERLALLEKAERLVMAAVPTVPVMFNRRQAMLADEVRGWYEDPLARQSFKRLWLEPATTPNANPEPRM